MKKYNLAPGDFPDIEDFKSKLAEQDFTKFNNFKPKLVEDAESVLSVEFPRLMEALPRSLDSYAPQAMLATPPAPANPSAPSPAGAPPFEEEGGNPFGDDDDAGTGKSEWILADYIPTYEPQFKTVQSGGFVTGGAAKSVLGGSGLPVTSLRKIWDLSDIDKDGMLDLQEFVIAMFLIDMVKKGHAVPDRLDEEMVPPNKKA